MWLLFGYAWRCNPVYIENLNFEVLSIVLVSQHNTSVHRITPLSIRCEAVVGIQYQSCTWVITFRSCKIVINASFFVKLALPSGPILSVDSFVTRNFIVIMLLIYLRLESSHPINTASAFSRANLHSTHSAWCHSERFPIR